MEKTVSLAILDAAKNTFSNRRIRSGILWSLLATIAGRSAGLVTSIAISRFLGKEVFGEYSMILSTILTFGVFAGFGTGLTATKHIAETFRTNPSRAGRILALSSIFAWVFGIVVTAALLFASPLIATRMLSAPRLAVLLQVASLSIAANALSGAQGGVLAGFEAFQSMSRVNIYSGVVSIIAVTAGVWLDGMEGALWGNNIASFISCAFGARAVRLATKDKGVNPDYRNAMREWPVVWKFSLPAMLSNMLVMPVTWVCSAMLVNRPHGFSEMAVYNVATQWRQLLLFLPGITAQVFLPIMASQASLNQGVTSQKLFAKTNLLVTVPVLLGMMFLSPVIMALYGGDYSEAWPVFVVVQLATFAQIIQAPAVTAWAADGRMWTNLFANIFWGSALIILSRALIKFGALGLSGALLLSFLLYFIVIIAADRRKAVNER